MQDNTFTPRGPTYAVGTSAVQIKPFGGEQCTSYRCANLNSTVNVLAWNVEIQGQTNPPSSLVAVAATVGTPATNVMSMQGNSVETFELPRNCWMVASQVSIEVTPGEGI